jgi:uncharacterized membrane protein YcgQ (UPF0703/DUF1980 family)
MTLSLALAFSVALFAAQDQGQPQNDQSSGIQQEQSTTNVTIAGCLEKGSAPNSFILNNAGNMGHGSMGDQGQQEQQGDQGNLNENENNMGQNQNGSTPSELARTQNSFALVPEGDVNLDNFVGQQVEVTGTVMPPTAGANTPDQMNQAGNQTEIRVASVRPIAKSCHK